MLIAHADITFKALWEGRRLDGRGWMDTRDLSVSFGSDWGSCQVLLHFKKNIGFTYNHKVITLTVIR